MSTLPSVCPLDCPDRCSLSVDVDGGHVTRIAGSRAYPWTDGYICAKVRGFGRRVHGDGRVTRPSVRHGDTWQHVSWDEALALVATRFRAIMAAEGPEAILPVWYGGSNGWLTGGGLDQRLWNRLGVSRCLRTLCAANTGAGTKMAYGAMTSGDVADVEHAAMCLVWGMNPSASGIHVVPPLKALQARGGRLVVVDPRRTPLAEAADLHLPVLPGADVPLALALAHVAFVEGLADVGWLEANATGWEDYRTAAMAWSPARAADATGVSPRDIEGLARMYAEASPAMVRCGWGIERTRNGSDSVRAVLLLPAVFGKFGVRGGGYAMSTSAGYRVDPAKWQGTSDARGVNLSRLARAIEETRDPPIRALYVYNCNPMATVPDQGRLARQLAREDVFVVVHEQVWTDTCDHADVVLPATSFLEHDELVRSYAGYVVQWAEPVIPPVGEARSNHVVLQDLGRRLGVDDPVTERELAAEILSHVPNAPDFETLRRERVALLPRPVQFVDTFPDGGRVRMSPPPVHRPPPCDADLPLILISPATQKAISSTMYETETDVPLEIHPDDAAARGITDGDLVRAFNPRGEVV
ncbi:MAG: molybdopterin-containing oxidoreductase family protein [Myxococcota bacterium]